MKERPIFPLLVSMALPMVLSMTVNALYNIVDSFFVAQISEQAMTALSLVYPVQNMINAIAIGFGVGINALIALYSGAGDRCRADTAATHGLVFSILHGLIAAVVCIAMMPGFLRLFTGDEAVIALGVRYSSIAFFFAPVIMAELCFEKLFQAVGRMNETMAALLCGSITNIILDPVLIFGLGPFPMLGISGAALATGIGQCVTLSVYLIIYCTHRFPVQLRLSCIKPDWRLDAKLYSIGVPAILNLALPSVLVSFLNSLLAAYSQGYVVILGIYYKLQTFLYLPAGGIVQGMRPLISYNYGAGEHGRVKKIYNLAMGMNAAIMATGTIICLVGSPALIGMFTTNADTIAAGQVALRIISAGFLVSTLSVTASGSLEALGKGTQSFIISLCRYIIIMIPAAWILCRLFGPVGVWHAFWVTELLSALAAALVYKRTIKLNV